MCDELSYKNSPSAENRRDCKQQLQTSFYFFHSVYESFFFFDVFFPGQVTLYQVNFFFDGSAGLAGFIAHYEHRI